MNGWLGYVWSEVYKASKSVAKAAVAYNVCFCGGNHCNFITKILCMLVPAYGISKNKTTIETRKKQTLRKIKCKNAGYEVKKHDRSFRFSSEQAIRLVNQACVCIQTIFHRPFNIGVYTHMVWCGVFSWSSIQCGVIFFVPFPSIQMMWSVSFFSFCRWSSTLSLATAGQEANKQKKIYKVDDSPASKCRQGLLEGKQLDHHTIRHRSHFSPRSYLSECLVVVFS